MTLLCVHIFDPIWELLLVSSNTTQGRYLCTYNADNFMRTTEIFMSTRQIFSCVQSRYLYVYKADNFMCTRQNPEILYHVSNDVYSVNEFMKHGVVEQIT